MTEMPSAIELLTCPFCNGAFHHFVWASSVPGEREALEQIKAICTDNDGDGCGHRLALRFVANVAARALIEQPAESKS